jgi:hypothetical protein
MFLEEKQKCLREEVANDGVSERIEVPIISEI